MMRRLELVALLSILAASSRSEPIPRALWGKWTVRRTLPAQTMSCWGERENKMFLGTEIEYSAAFFRWQRPVTKNPDAEVAQVTAMEFHDFNSGGGANESQVNFRQLSIKAPSATQIMIKHPAANLTGGTIEIPGDFVLLKGRDAIVVRACNVYFEATRR